LKAQKALLILDAQVNMFDESFQIHRADEIISTLSSLIEKARSKDVPVMYLRNNGPVGEPDEPGTPGWEIHLSFAPRDNELVIDKHTPDGFHETELKAKLDKLGIQHLVVAGMQSEMCVDSTVRKAVELGYKVTLVKDGHSTFDFEDASAVDTINRINKELNEVARVVHSDSIEF
jgi:nicotinamidase-related amidase